jgi:O-antigen/teichoic acid export membrane protein
MSASARSRPLSDAEGESAGWALASDSPRLSGLSWMLAAELLAGGLGFVVMVRLARCLGPPGYARVEYAAAVAAWLLVIVRGGVDVIVTREAARRPRLVRPLTDALIGLRCAAAVLGYVMVLAMGALLGSERGPVVAVAGLMLFPAALVTDVGLRAAGRLRWLAVNQSIRAVGYALAVHSLVRGPGDTIVAACCLVGAETLAAIVPLALHTREHGLPRPRLRRRLAFVLAQRGLIAGLIRFGRVSLYGIDLLALGWWVGPEIEFGAYAAARRLVFGLVALGLVAPASVAPLIARGWALGAHSARGLVTSALCGLWTVSLPTAVGLALTADRWMPLLFGAGYSHGGPLLALVAARLPWLLAASFDQAALVSCRRETWVLDQMMVLVTLAALIVPLAVMAGGPWGVGWAALLIEIMAAIGGWRRLVRLGVAPAWHHQAGPAVAGSLALAAVCSLTRAWPLWAVTLTAAIAYAATWHALTGRWMPRMLRREFAS